MSVKSGLKRVRFSFFTPPPAPWRGARAVPHYSLTPCSQALVSVPADSNSLSPRSGRLRIRIIPYLYLLYGLRNFGFFFLSLYLSRSRDPYSSSPRPPPAPHIGAHEQHPHSTPAQRATTAPSRCTPRTGAMRNRQPNIKSVAQRKNGWSQR